MVGVGSTQLRDCSTLLRAEDVHISYDLGRRRSVEAISGISFDVRPGETLNLVGESGCGKSTTARSIVGLVRPSAGSMRFEGRELADADERSFREIRSDLQMIFQDPRAALNPRRSVRDLIGEGLEIRGMRGARLRQRVDEILHAVGFDPAIIGDRRPPEFSGGQCQRFSIARALILEPKLLVCDEPVSALDVSVQAQILNLLADLKQKMGLSLVFVSHDLSVVRALGDRVAVMYLGRLCEIGPVDRIFSRPAHPYTSMLLASVPTIKKGIEQRQSERAATEAPPEPRGEVPSMYAAPSGCRFRTRCPYAFDRCRDEIPEMRRVGDDHFVACHLENRPGHLQLQRSPVDQPVPPPASSTREPRNPKEERHD